MSTKSRSVNPFGFYLVIQNGKTIRKPCSRSLQEKRSEEKK